jgi:quercetin dioxygenase-like cupin family protein
MPMSQVKVYRRIVTGHNEAGVATFAEDAACPHAHPITGGVVTTEFWCHSAPPDNAADYADPISPDVAIAPPHGGSVLRIVEFPPHPDVEPYRHQTASLDYCIVLEGEIYAIVGSEEKLMRAGDVLIQRGTLHSWANRADEPCRVMFVLIDAPQLA